MPLTVLVTGAAGFIGFHTASRLLQAGDRVIGVDNLNAYYDPALKEARLDLLRNFDGFEFAEQGIEDAPRLMALFAEHRPDVVVNLAAQAGVRYSLEDPHAYVTANMSGFLSVLEACRHHPVRHLVYASTSSVYGLNGAMPFSEHAATEHPISLYSASKKANEMMAHSYAHLFNVPATGLRFFTVYGPWGRPDMALFKFTKAILADEPIPIFNKGDMVRDFTFIDDIAEAVVRICDTPPEPNPDWSADDPDPATSPTGPYRIYNIGNADPVPLMTYIEELERALGRQAKKQFLPMQPGDVPKTWADVGDLQRDHGYRPATSVRDGVTAFVNWYRDYYDV